MLKITKKEFRLLADFINENYGIYLKDEKETLVLGRLMGVLSKYDLKSFTEFMNIICQNKNGELARILIDKITTHHTFFMRESNHFEYFKTRVLPYLATTVKDRDLRIWCAACSTGEEAYTIAMLLDEFFSLDRNVWDKKLLATDISNEVLKIAANGIYSEERIGPLPYYWKKSYFKQVDEENFMVIDRIKENVLFRCFNLTNAIYPFKKKFHVIFCRNVMIYFDNDTKEALIRKLYDSLEVGGYLFIGHSETINREVTPFKYIMPAVYRK